MPTFLPKLVLKNIGKSNASDGQIPVWIDAIGAWVPRTAHATYSVDGGSSSTTVWNFTVDGGSSSSTYSPFTVLDGGDSDG